MPFVVEKRSYDSVTVFWLNRQEAVRRLREAAAELVERRPEVESVHLFGSLAEGRALPGSDADVLIVLRAASTARSEPAEAETARAGAAGPEARTEPARWLDRPAAYQPFFEGVGLPVDIVCYTRAEIERHPFARQALARSILLAPPARASQG